MVFTCPSAHLYAPWPMVRSFGGLGFGSPFVFERLQTVTHGSPVIAHGSSAAANDSSVVAHGPNGSQNEYLKTQQGTLRFFMSVKQVMFSK